MKNATNIPSPYASAANFSRWCWLVLLTGCATIPAPPTVHPQWPAPPEEPRITYVQSLRQPADAGIQPSGLRRFLGYLFGHQSPADQLQKPFGLALDESDNLCLTDTGAKAVIYHDRTRQRWHRWTRLGKLEFTEPIAIAKRHEIFYVADTGRVLAFRDGHLLFQLTNHLQRPTGLAIVGDQLFVADAQRHCIVRFDLTGHYQTEFGRRGTADGEFNFPTHLATDARQRLLVTDSLNCRIQIFDTTGRFLTKIGRPGDGLGCFSRPKGAAVDSHGHVYVLDANFDNFQIFNPAGQLLLPVGEAGTDPGQFWLPNGIAISSKNEIFVTDGYNHRVQIFQYQEQP